MNYVATSLLAIAVLGGCRREAPEAEYPQAAPELSPGEPRQPSGVDAEAAVEAVADSTLVAFVVDIGQGDATVVLGPEEGGRRRALVIDAGNRAPDGGRIVRELLTEQGIATLDYVVLSHFDGDHIGGFVTISNSTSLLWTCGETDECTCDPTGLFPSVAVFDQGHDTNQSQSSLEWQTCIAKITTEKGVDHKNVRDGIGVGTTLNLGGEFVATLVAGDGYVLGSAERVARVNTPNERSIAVLVSNGEFDFLITGDLIGQEAGAEDAHVERALGAALAARGIDIEVLRTGHHGAANATEATFVRQSKPEVAIISTGDDHGKLQAPSLQDVGDT